MMDEKKYLQMREQLKEFERVAKENFPLQKDDNVEYEARPATEDEEAGWSNGFVERVDFDEKEGKAFVKVKDKRSSKWQRLGDNTRFYLEDVGRKINKIENPVDEERIRELEIALDDIEEDMNLTRMQYKQKKEAVEQEISKLQGKCIHRWNKGEFVEEETTIFGGVTEIHEYTCEICGLTKKE